MFTDLMHWPISLDKKLRHASQKGLKFHIRRWIVWWRYPFRIPIAILPGITDHYKEMYDWLTEMVPDHADSVWLVLDGILSNPTKQIEYISGEIRFKSKEIYTLFLLRWPIDSTLERAII